MACCSTRKKQSNLVPPVIDELKRNPKFSTYNEEELFEYYYEFKEITQSSDYLNKKQFYDLIRAFNVSL